MDDQAFHKWLTKYGEVWESRYPEGVADLYSEDVLYYWTPFEEPKRGRQEIVAASREATSRQENIHFRYEVIAVEENKGWARWWCSFRRVPEGHPVRIDGILQATFDEHGLCTEFREWWHGEEPSSESSSEA
ncbi:MAG: nuclear transport factor 2 family protein [Actinomycetota bacterium]